jgi:thiosulfate dehydrogenase [quinone] large subunit
MTTKLQKFDTALFPLALSGARSLIGLMWLLSLRWKLPPAFAPIEGRGLMDWMELQVAHPTLDLYANFVANLVLPNFLLFAWLTFLIELTIGLSLTFGALTRWGAFLGLLWSFNLAIGLLKVPGEWPWSYLMLIMWHGLFLVSTPYQRWGVDGWRRQQKSRQN